MEKQQNAPHPFVLTPPVFPRTRVEQGAEEKGSGRAGERESEGSMEAEDDTKAPLLTQAPVPAPPSATPPFPHARPPAHWSHIRQIQQGETVTCGMTLLGAANAALPYLVLAWHELAAQGLGRGRQPFVLDSVARVSPAGERQPIYDARTQRLDAADTGYGLNDYVAARLAGWPVDAGADAPVTVRFVTPARVMHQGRLQARADFSLLARTLLRRVSLAQLAHGAGPLVLPFRALLDEAATVTPGLARWSWWDWGRWSERQQTRMKLGGFIGRAEFSGPALTGFLPLLAAGEVLGLGSSTSFGLGRIEIECPAGATPERTA